MTADHHSEYLELTVEALTPEGHARVDELLDQLAAAAVDREWLVAFAKARRTEADQGRARTPRVDEPSDRLTEQELDALVRGFSVIRDTEPLDDVADWANAVLALLRDELGD